jgi:hypothetical protein
MGQIAVMNGGLMDIATVETYLKQYGWEFEQTEDDVIITDFAAGEAHFLVAIQLAAPWLRLCIPAYLPTPADDRWPEVAKLLFRLNHQSRMVRFAADDHDQLTLCADLYTEGDLDYAQFEIALDALTYVAETAHPHLLEAIHPAPDSSESNQ